VDHFAGHAGHVRPELGQRAFQIPRRHLHVHHPHGAVSGYGGPEQLEVQGLDARDVAQAYGARPARWIDEQDVHGRLTARAPIAATPVGGAREVLGMMAGQSDSPYAVTFTPGDPAGAVRAIDSALATPETTTAAARRWVLERFTLDRMAADYAELFARLAGPEAPRAAA